MDKRNVSSGTSSRIFKINDVTLNSQQYANLCLFANIIRSDLASRHLDTLSDTEFLCLRQLEKCGLLTEQDLSYDCIGQPTYISCHSYLSNTELVALYRIAKIITLDTEYKQLRILSKKDRARVELLEKCGFIEPFSHTEGIIGQSVFTKSITLH